MPFSAPRETCFAALACLLAGALAGPARAQISQRESAREYVAELRERIERLEDERDRALEALAEEKKKAKDVVARTLAKAVAREGALAGAKHRIEELEGEIASLVEARRQADADHAARETELVDRARAAESARVEALRQNEELETKSRSELETTRAEAVRRVEELETKARNDLETAQAHARAEIEALRADVAVARAEAEHARRLAMQRDDIVRETNALHAKQLGDLQSHILALERTIVSESEARLALESRAPLGSGTTTERIAGLERDLAAKEGEIAALARQSAVDKKELRALRTARDGLEKELLAVRSTVDTTPGGSLSEWAGEEREPEELRRLLALERERRSTLEGELVRLSATGDVAERYRESWQALQAARADLLLLSERLSAEQAKREELEALLTKASDDADAGQLDRLRDVASEHGRDTERLEKELAEANDHVTRLRGFLETMESPDGGAATVAKLDEENGKLRTSLAAAEQTIGRLTGKAALAERLAELVYSRGP